VSSLLTIYWFSWFLGGLSKGDLRGVGFDFYNCIFSPFTYIIGINDGCSNVFE